MLNSLTQGEKSIRGKIHPRENPSEGKLRGKPTKVWVKQIVKRIGNVTEPKGNRPDTTENTTQGQHRHIEAKQKKSAIFPLIKCRSTYEKSMNGQSSNITGHHLLSLLHDFQNL